MANDPIQTSGRTVDDAVQTALRRLGLSRAEVNVEVITEGRSGILGIGNTKATVRVTPIHDVQPETDTGSEPAPLPRIDDYADSRELEPGRQPARRDQRRHAPHRRILNRPNDGADVQPTDYRARSRSRSRESLSRRGDRDPDGRSGRGSNRDTRDRRPNRREPDRVRSEPRPPIEPFELLADPDFEPPDDPREFASELLMDIIHLLGFDTIIEARDPQTPMDGLDLAVAVLDVKPKQGDDLGLLIGRHGSHIAALQYIVNVIISNTLEGSNPITVDIDGYKRRREAALEEIAQRAAEEVREYGEPVELSPMPAAERRIIHLAVQNDPELTSDSVGAGSARRVQIAYRDEA